MPGKRFSGYDYILGGDTMTKSSQHKLMAEFFSFANKKKPLVAYSYKEDQMENLDNLRGWRSSLRPFRVLVLKPMS